MSLNDEALTGATEYNSGGAKPADRGFERAENNPRGETLSAGDGTTTGVSDAATEYGNTPVGTGSTNVGTTNTTVDAGGATIGTGANATGPGGSTTLGAGDSMDDTSDGPGGMDPKMIEAIRAGAGKTSPGPAEDKSGS